MKGDFSKWDSGRRIGHRGVLHQQGRVLLDSDWNAQTMTMIDWQDHAARDSMGPGVAAVPARAPESFRVEAARVLPSGEVSIDLRPGRIWADGLPVRQPGMYHRPGGVARRTADYFPPPIHDPTVGSADIGSGTRDAVILEVWQEALNGFQIPRHLIEPALGGPDTTERVEMASRLRLLRLGEGEDCRNLAGILHSLDPEPGRLTASLLPTIETDGDCPVTQGGGYTGFEHNLYRIEIADLDDDILVKQGPMFKWSRFNGGLVGRGLCQFDSTRKAFTITANHQQIRMSGLTEFYLEVVEFDQDRGFWETTYGAMVTLHGDDLEVADGYVYRSGQNPPSGTVFIRLWDGIRRIGEFPEASQGNRPVELRDGILLEFAATADRMYRPGDHWTFSVRAGDIQTALDTYHADFTDSDGSVPVWLPTGAEQDWAPRGGTGTVPGPVSGSGAGSGTPGGDTTPGKGILPSLIPKILRRGDGGASPTLPRSATEAGTNTGMDTGTGTGTGTDTGTDTGTETEGALSGTGTTGGSGGSTFLFNLDRRYIDTLSDGKRVERKLRKAFEDHDIPLSRSARVSKVTEGHWQIPEEDRTFNIRDNGNQLDVTNSTHSGFSLSSSPPASALSSIASTSSSTSSSSSPSSSTSSSSRGRLPFLPGKRKTGNVHDLPRLLYDQPPQGIRYHRVPLAVLNWRKTRSVNLGDDEITDCRKIFHPLTGQNLCCSLRVGDGISTFGDFDSLEEAVRHLPETGGDICLLPGIHRTNLLVEDREHITFRGCGHRSKVIPGELGWEVPIFHIRDSRFITLENMEIDSIGGSAMVMEGTEPGDLQAITIRNNAIMATVNAIRITGAIDVTIQENTIHMWDRDQGDAAISVSSEDVLIRQNTVAVIPPHMKPPAGGTPPTLSRADPVDPCADPGLIYANLSYLSVLVNHIRAIPIHQFVPLNPYRAPGGIRIESGAERVRIIENRIVGGSGNGITLGSMPDMGRLTPSPDEGFTIPQGSVLPPKGTTAPGKGMMPQGGMMSTRNPGKVTGKGGKDISGISSSSASAKIEAAMGQGAHTVSGTPGSAGKKMQVLVRTEGNEPLSGVVFSLSSGSTGHERISAHGSFTAEADGKGDQTLSVLTPGYRIKGIDKVPSTATLQQAGTELVMKVTLEAVEEDQGGRVEDVLDFLYDIHIYGNTIRNMGLSGIGVPRMDLGRDGTPSHLPTPAAASRASLSTPGQSLSMALISKFGFLGGYVVDLSIQRNQIEGCLRNSYIPSTAGELIGRGIGGISLGFCENVLIHENRIEKNGTDHNNPVCGIYVFYGNQVDVSHNYIIDNGAIPADQTRLRSGMWAGIAMIFATSLTRIPDPSLSRTMVTRGGHAARIHGNVVDQPVGRPLTLGAFGPVSVVDNLFNSEISAPGIINTAVGGALIINLGGGFTNVTDFLGAFRETQAQGAQTVPSTVLGPVSSYGVAPMTAGGYTAQAQVATKAEMASHGAVMQVQRSMMGSQVTKDAMARAATATSAGITSGGLTGGQASWDPASGGTTAPTAQGRTDDPGTSAQQTMLTVTPAQLTLQAEPVNLRIPGGTTLFQNNQTRLGPGNRSIISQLILTADDLGFASNQSDILHTSHRINTLLGGITLRAGDSRFKEQVVQGQAATRASLLTVTKSLNNTHNNQGNHCIIATSLMEAINPYLGYRHSEGNQVLLPAKQHCPTLQATLASQPILLLQILTNLVRGLRP